MNIKVLEVLISSRGSFEDIFMVAVADGIAFIQSKYMGNFAYNMCQTD